MTLRHPTSTQKAMAIVVALLTLGVAIFSLYHCGSSKSPTTPPAAATCDGQSLGSSRSQGCPSGQVGAITQVCQASGWTTVATTCAAPTPPPPTPPANPTPPSGPTGCNHPTFDDNIQAIMAANCAACHAPTYQTTQILGATEMARRVALPVSDNDHMPQPIGNNPAVSLSPDDVKTIQEWSSIGAPQNCSSVGGGTTFIDLNYQDTAALNDAEALPVQQHNNVIYLYAGHAIDQGAAVKTWVQAINKALNGTNNDSNVVTQVVPVDPNGAVYRVDLAAFGLSAADLSAILAADVNLNITDNTTKGKQLAGLLGHKPWLHLDNWIDITYRNSSVYYQLIGNPKNIGQFEKNAGVNIERDLADLTNINLIGSTSSPIAEQKNRLLLRDTAASLGNTVGCYWRTFDVNGEPNNIQVVINGQVVNDNTKNLIQNPLLSGAGQNAGVTPAQAVFTQDASEAIACAKNGFLTYFLADGQGNRLNAADPNVVRDTMTPVGNGQINDANSCVRCHNAGFIPMADQILSIDGHTSQLAASDVQLVQVLYGGDAAAGAMFKKDSSIFLQALALAGVTNGPDPMSAVTDNYLENYDINKASALFFVTPAQFTQCVQQSAATLAALGNILPTSQSPTGGQVTFVQLVAAIPQLLVDCPNFFNDPVGG